MKYNFGLLVFLLLLCTSCKVCEPITIVKDSVRVEQRLDSVYFYEKDSVYIDRWRSNDTIYLTTERYSVRYKDKLIEVHDTISNTNTETIVQREKYVPGFYKWSAWVCWLLIAFILLRIVWWFIKKYYIR